MKPQFNQTRFLSAVIISLVIVGVLISATHNSKSLVFEINPLSFGGNVPNPSILCHVNMAVHENNENGDRIKTAKSEFHTTNPMTNFKISSLSFTDRQSGSTVGSFDAIPEIKCIVDGNTPLTIQSSELKIKVFSKDHDNIKKETFNWTQTSKSFDLLDASHKEILSFRINVPHIMKQLPEGNYPSLQEFDLTGRLNVVYRDYPTVVYVIDIKSGEVITWHDIKIINDNPSTIENTNQQICEDNNRQFVNNECVAKSNSNTQTSTGSSSTTPGTSTIETNPIKQVTKFMYCATNGDMSCLQSSEFLPYYLGIFGLIVVIFAISKKTRQPVYGIPQ